MDWREEGREASLEAACLVQGQSSDAGAKGRF